MTNRQLLAWVLVWDIAAIISLIAMIVTAALYWISESMTVFLGWIGFLVLNFIAQKNADALIELKNEERNGK